MTTRPADSPFAAPSTSSADTPTAPNRAVPTRMNAVMATRYGTEDVLTVEEIPVPTPADDEILLQVEAASLNALDWHFMTGTPYLIRPTSGLLRPRASRRILGADAAGVVRAVGAKVSTVAVGDALFGEVPGGACAPYLTVKADRLVAIPDGVSFDDAAATPVAGLTALQGLRTHADVQPGERVLVNGAAGGVGTFAVQIAKALGAHVTGVCSTRNVEMVQRIGADEVVNYTADDFVARHSTGDDVRFDVMFDNVGRRSPAENLSVLRPEGRFVMITGPKENPWLGPVGAVIRTALAFRRASQSFHQFTASPKADDLNRLGQLLATGQVVPEIQRVIGLDGVVEAMAEIGTGHTRAKIVVRPGA